MIIVSAPMQAKVDGQSVVILVTEQGNVKKFLNQTQIENLKRVDEVWIIGPNAWELHDSLDDQIDGLGPITNAEVELDSLQLVLDEVLKPIPLISVVCICSDQYIEYCRKIVDRVNRSVSN